MNAEERMRKALQQLGYENGLTEKTPCTNQENKAFAKMLREGQPLPEGVYEYDGALIAGQSTNAFYRIHEAALSDAERAELLYQSQIRFFCQGLRLLRRIKGYTLFFVVINVFWLLFVFFFGNI